MLGSYIMLFSYIHSNWIIIIIDNNWKIWVSVFIWPNIDSLFSIIYTVFCEIALLQVMFPTQGLNPHLSHLLHWQLGSLPPAQPVKPIISTTIINTLSGSVHQMLSPAKDAFSAFNITILIVFFAAACAHIYLLPILLMTMWKMGKQWKQCQTLFFGAPRLQNHCRWWLQPWN